MEPLTEGASIYRSETIISGDAIATTDDRVTLIMSDVIATIAAASDSAIYDGYKLTGNYQIRIAAEMEIEA